jgi:hypothetical protein
MPVKRIILGLIGIAVLTGPSPLAAGFRGAGGFSVAVYQPDFGPINEALRSIDMPELDKPVFVYGGQGFGYISERFAIGGGGFGGFATVNDLENGYARTARFNIGWGGIILEYRLLELSRVDILAGGILGWGGVSLHLQKNLSPVSWDEIWENYEAIADTAQNISSDLTHSFFVLQPRLGVRVYLTEWMALGGSVEFPVSNLSSAGWRLNDEQVYDAPSMKLTAPFFHLSILFGG